ncbi:MAG: hypothetical protein P8J87_06650 [Verrucomicrobiales bacterium]|nr:hypothetical protein [Verrucomicrobiales bacterium]
MTKLAIVAVAGTVALASNAAADEKVNFEKQILPVLEKKCIKCHKKPYTDERGRLKKPKSGLRMDGAKFYAKGGDIQEDEDKKVLVAGKSGESTLYTFTMLPEEDDLFMPPKGDAMTADEKALLKQWIDQGAEFGDWKGEESE